MSQLQKAYAALFSSIFILMTLLVGKKLINGDDRLAVYIITELSLTGALYFIQKLFSK